MKAHLRIMDRVMIIGILIVSVLIYLEISNSPVDRELETFYKMNR